MKQLLIILSCLGLSLSAHAQFNAFLYSLTPLTTHCGEGEPLGPDCNGVIYWDENSNGPDLVDQPVPVGDEFAQANFNTFPINGAVMFGTPGTFMTETAFTISTNTPQPSRYYVVVECGFSHWTSAVILIENGVNDYDISEGWSCYGVGCDAPPSFEYTVPENPNSIVPFSDCLYLCEGVPVPISFGPLEPRERPFSHIMPGCAVSFHCSEDCQPAQFTYSDAEWFYDASTSRWTNWITPGTSGCVCYTVEMFGAVEGLDLVAVPRDGEVEILWQTLVETEMERFDVLRRVGEREYEAIGSRPATNNSTTTNYRFVDEDAANGTTYEYTLKLVDINGTETILSTSVLATPSINAALITEYALHQNYPNPFNPSTYIVYDVVADNFVTLKIFNLTGQEVATLVNGTMSAGRHTASFDATNLTSGMYLYTVKIGEEYTATKKMLLVK